MGHDTHNTDSRPGSSLTSSVWFALLLIGLFIATVNFVDVMSHDDGGHGEEAAHTEHAAPAHDDHSHDGHGHDEAHQH